MSSSALSLVGKGTDETQPAYFKRDDPRSAARLRRLAAGSGDRIIDWAGDGCFVTFETPSAAVLFALRLQQAQGEKPDLPGVRTGIHMGEVSERLGLVTGCPIHGCCIEHIIRRSRSWQCG